MRIQVLGAALALLFCTVAAGARELKECVQFTVNPGGEASLTNVCADRLNLMYCLDNPRSGRACSAGRRDITTLAPSARETIPSYSADGAGSIYWAVCAYPEAPVDWKPGPDAAYACKKTCVMC